MIIVKTPLRISFAGGGSDIPKFYEKFGGATLSTTIDKYVYITVHNNFHKQVRLSYSKTEIVDFSEQLEHSRAKCCLKMLGIPTGLEIVTMADVPSKGTGLGSSSSFTVGLLKALHAHQGHKIDKSKLAEQACYIEIEQLKEPIGKQDQYIASFGGFKFIEYFSHNLLRVNDVLINPNTLKKLESSLLLFYTGIQRPTNKVLEKQVARIEESAPIAALKRMVELAYSLRKELEQGRPESLGEILHESWELKKTLADCITNSEINAMYDDARKNGAVGGKLLGAGGGGFLLVYAPQVSHEKIIHALQKYRLMPFKFEAEGSKILYKDIDKIRYDRTK